MISPDSPLDILTRTGALREGHFLLPDGTHTGTMPRVGKALQFAPFNRKLCYQIVRHFLELDIHVVMAASPGAIPATVEIGRQLEARAIFTDDAAGPPTLRDGFELHEGERGLLVQDLLLDDASLAGHIALFRRFDTRLVGIGSIVDARRKKERVTVRDVSAIELLPERYEASSCPLCASGVPLSA
ncbi:MAG: hypothetical protein ABIR47_09880 [Candidatus Kapaibacterium sp.]